MTKEQIRSFLTLKNVESVTNRQPNMSTTEPQLVSVAEPFSGVQFRMAVTANILAEKMALAQSI